MSTFLLFSSALAFVCVGAFFIVDINFNKAKLSLKIANKLF
jgi:hypothetical protein